MSDHTKERAALRTVLDDYRRTVVWKLDGLSRDDAVTPRVPSGTSLLGVVKHLAYVERWWFQAVIGRRDPEFPWSEDDPDADWRIDDGESVEDIIDLFWAECTISNEILEGLESLDAEYQRRDEMLTARGIILHMIEEIARHAGHTDILRELADGTTGYWPPNVE